MLFLDILGSSLLATDKHAAHNLSRLFNALEFASQVALIKRSNAPYRVATFTDNLVVGWPLTPLDRSGVWRTVREAAAYQYALTRFGFFARGGLSCGLHYMSDDFIFGPALIEAYGLEHDAAIQPRIVVGESALRAFRRARRRKNGPSSADARMIIRSGDQQVFVNYLETIAVDRASAPAELLKHREGVMNGLARWPRFSSVWEKYRWLADYHNHFCRTRFPRIPNLLIPATHASTHFTPVL